MTKYVYVIAGSPVRIFRSTGNLGRALREEGFTIPSGALGAIKVEGAGATLTAKGKGGAVATVEKHELF